jgi:hypothetical protein
MTPSPSTRESSPSSAGPRGRVPPDERFWKRRSPHGELPLSATGSVALHVLVIGLLLLGGAYLTGLFFKPTGTLPIEPVRLGGGGSSPQKGVEGQEPDAEEKREAAEGEKDPAAVDEPPARPPLTRPKLQELKRDYRDIDYRWFRKNDTDNARIWGELKAGARRKLSRGLDPVRGQGGSADGGKGPGIGPDNGEGRGPGGSKATLTQRQKRMLRWHMHFPARRTADYLNQLAGLGAILAIPTTNDRNPDYLVVRNLRSRPARANPEDVSKIRRIFWTDINPDSVAEVMRELGLPGQPNHFAAFMPVQLENKLFELEKTYYRSKYRRKVFNEDDIYETRFRVVLGRRGFEPVLVSMKLKRGG